MSRLEAFGAYYEAGAMALSPARMIAAWKRYERTAAAVDTLGEDLLVLDVGCGPGQVARMVAANHRVVGVDIAPEPLHEFAQFGFAVLGDALALPFDDATFDVALCGQTLYHLPYERALGELARVVRPGGHLVLEQGMRVDVSLWPLLAYWSVRRRAPGRFRLPYESGRPSWRSLRRALANSGFTVERREGLEISTGPLYDRARDRRLDVVADEFASVSSQQLIVARRR